VLDQCRGVSAKMDDRKRPSSRKMDNRVKGPPASMLERLVQKFPSGVHPRGGLDGKGNSTGYGGIDGIGGSDRLRTG